METLSIEPVSEKKELHEVLNKALKNYFINVDKTERLVVLRRKDKDEYAKSSVK